MNADLRGILGTIGQSASLMFAAFVFMGFLQQRYTAAVDRYRDVVDEYRSDRLAGRRRRVIHEEVALYKRRCELMKRATAAALVAGTALTVTLLCAVWSAMLPGWAVLRRLGVATAVLGLTLIVGACVFVLQENSILQFVIDAEIRDQPELGDSHDPVGAGEPDRGRRPEHRDGRPNDTGSPEARSDRHDRPDVPQFF